MTYGITFCTPEHVCSHRLAKGVATCLCERTETDNAGRVTTYRPETVLLGTSCPHGHGKLGWRYQQEGINSSGVV